MTPLRTKRQDKINRIPPQGPVKSRHDKAADLVFRNEHPDKPEPKSKRVLTEVEKEFWSGLTS